MYPHSEINIPARKAGSGRTLLDGKDKQTKNLLVFPQFIEWLWMSSEGVMAESEGFEPPIALRLCLISSQVHSTGLCQLSAV